MPGRSWTSRRRKFTTASSGESRRSRRLFAPAARGTSTGISGSCLEPSSWHYCCSERVKDDRRETAWARAPRDDPARAARVARHRHDPEAQGPAPVPAGCRGPSAIPRPRQAPPQEHGAGGHGLALVPVVWAGPPAFPLGDALMLLGLLALARFLAAVGALDAGGAFGGMGASR